MPRVGCLAPDGVASQAMKGRSITIVGTWLCQRPPSRPGAGSSHEMERMHHLADTSLSEEPALRCLPGCHGACQPRLKYRTSTGYRVRRWVVIDCSWPPCVIATSRRPWQLLGLRHGHRPRTCPWASVCTSAQPLGARRAATGCTGAWRLGASPSTWLTWMAPGWRQKAHCQRPSRDAARGHGGGAGGRLPQSGLPAPRGAAARGARRAHSAQSTEMADA